MFVANDVSEICDLIGHSTWALVPGNLNPADVLSHGVGNPEDLVQGDWFTGPKFLQGGEDEWSRTSQTSTKMIPEEY